MKNEKLFNRLFNAFVLGGMTVCVILSCIGKMQQPDARKALLVISAFGALMGVASTVLSANGSIWNFLFGLLDVSIYSYILYDSNMPSQFLLHVLYFVPMEFVGFFQWRKRGAGKKSKVKARRLNARDGVRYLLLFIGVFAVSFTVSWMLISRGGDAMNYPKMALDATVTTANIVALVLMSFAYMEQWYLWTLVNLSSVVLWTVTLVTVPSADYAIIPVVKYCFYLVNGLNGLRIWYNLSRK